MTNRLKASGHSVKPKDFLKFHDIQFRDCNDTVVVAKAINQAVFDILVLYYGIYPDNIQPVLVDKVTEIIATEHPEFTIKQLKYCFERVSIEKMITVNMNDILKPIRQYVFSLKQIEKERSIFEKEQIEESQAQEKLQEVRAEAIELYKNGLISKQWTGTVFHAHVIAKEFFSDKFDQWEKNQIWEEAKELRSKIVNNENSTYLEIGKSAERLFSELIVKAAIEKGIEI